MVRRAEVLAALALTALYLAVMSGHLYSSDGLLMYRQAVSILHDHSLRFAVPINWGDTLTTSRYGIGLSLLYLPGVALLALAGVSVPAPTALPYDWTLFYGDVAYAIGSAPVHILVAVATAYLVARLIQELGHSRKTALFGLASYGIASPAIVYARGDFAQPLLGLCLIFAFVAAARYRTSGRLTPLAWASASLVIAVLTRPVEGSFLLPALLLAIVSDLHLVRWTSSTLKAVAIVALGYLIGVALTLLVNWGRFGSPFVTGYASAINWTTPFWVGIPGVLVSPARGILWQFPLLLLAPLGLRQIWHTPHRRVSLAMTALIVVLFLNTALWVPWWGAWSWGSRLFVPAWPMIAVFAAIGAASLRKRRRVWLPGVLFVAGVLWAVPGTLTDLLGGYASTYDGSWQSFTLAGYPPIGAWRFLHHLRAVSLMDPNAIDIFWFRIARKTYNVSMVVPVILTLAAITLAWASLHAERESRDVSRVSFQATRSAPAKD